MHFQRKLHDALEGKSVAARARRAAFDVAAEADAEIARLQAQLSESRQQTDALFKTGLSYCDKIDALKAQVDALAVALEHATKLNGFRAFNDYIPTMRAALAAAGRQSTEPAPDPGPCAL